MPDPSTPAIPHQWLDVPVGGSVHIVTRIEYEESPTPGHVIRHVSFASYVTYPPTEVPDARDRRTPDRYPPRVI